MKLTAQMKQAYMNACTTRLLPTETVGPEKKQLNFLQAAYDNWVAINITPFTNATIEKFIPKQATINLILKFEGKTLPNFINIKANTMYESRGTFSSWSRFYAAKNNYTLASANPVFYSDVQHGRYQSGSVVIAIDADQYAEYEALYAEMQEATEKYSKLLETTHKALTGSNTDGQLKDNYPAIYANMPPYVRNILNADIEKKSEARLEREKAKARKLLNIPEPVAEAKVELDSDYKEAEAALRKAAFINN